MMLPLVLLAQEDAGGLPAPFQPTIGLMIWTFVVFIPLFLLLKRTVYPWIVQTAVEREAAIKKQLADADRLQKEAAALLEEHRHLLASGRGEAQAIIAEARQAADRERALGVEKTRQEQSELLAHAKREIEAERERAVAEIRREAVDLAIAAAGKVVGSRLAGADDRKLVEDFIASIGAQG